MLPQERLMSWNLLLKKIVCCASVSATELFLNLAEVVLMKLNVLKFMQCKNLPAHRAVGNFFLRQLHELHA
jgi:hypothetical protein